MGNGITFDEKEFTYDLTQIYFLRTRSLRLSGPCLSGYNKNELVWICLKFSAVQNQPTTFRVL